MAEFTGGMYDDWFGIDPLDLETEFDDFLRQVRLNL
jgi:hypothetical protein